jgi:hypothetical protein
MINEKGCHAFSFGTEKEGKRANYWRDRERERVRGRASERREVVSMVQRY